MPGAALIMSFAIAVLTNGAVAEGNPAGDRFAVDEPEQQTEPNAPVCALTLDSFVNPDNAPPKVTTVNPPEQLEADAEEPPAPQRSRNCGRPLPAQS